jgi:uncharacterized surface protein with fasciclin (FAS1) repeats
MRLSFASTALIGLLATTLSAVSGAPSQHLRRTREQADGKALVTLPQNVEEINWFVDKDGRDLQTTVKPMQDMIGQVFVLSFLEAALVFSGLANKLGSNEGPFTLFCTWDYEWERQPYYTKFKTQPWRAHLREFISYNMYPGILDEDSLPASSNNYMLNGEAVAMTWNGQRSNINGLRNIGTQEATDGYIYLMQHMLAPSFMDLSLFQVISSDHSTFAGLLVGAGLSDELSDLSDTVGYTVFAPTNAAFNRVSSGYVDYLESNAGSSDRLALVRYHLATTVTPTMNLYPGANQPVTTVQGSQLSVKWTAAGTLTVTAAQNVATATVVDKLAYNGIIHVMNDVLLLTDPVSESTSAPLNANTYIRSQVDNSVFSDSSSYQSQALSFVTSNCDGCGVDTYKIMQRYVLACIYYATYQKTNPIQSTSRAWSKRTGWVSASDECAWHGISCNDDGQVNFINLRDNRLSGTFPAETAILAPSLEVLDLTRNDMYNDGGPDNDWLGSLVNLRYLSVRETGFSYPGIPPAIGQLTKLTDLDVSYCLYFGALNSNVFANLNLVTYLDISGNHYSGANAPSTIGGMDSLMYFYAIDAGLQGDLGFITSSRTLAEVWIDDNPSFGGAIPAAIGDIQSLVSLSLTDNALAGQIPTNLGNCGLLRQVWLYGNNLSGSVPTHIGQLQWLQRFEIFENSISTGNIPSQLCALRSNSLISLAADCSEVGCQSGCCTCCSGCRPQDETN